MPQPKDIDWLAKWIHKTCIYAVNKRPTSDLGTHTDWKWVDIKSYSIQIGNQTKESWNSNVCISEKKIALKMKTVKETKDIMINGSIQEEVTIVNIYVPSIGAPNHTRQMLISHKRRQQ